ncbi:DUF1853 family protein [Psychroflexus planctonicus]|uniref:DUF1853 family protein n=1 Tax=Psychroflexus planctonicus TaxID=1526575 RepID=A0ABQ1SCV0_9FLAO|nr:DUF1853 family protein [Psychroflexus planctonicus]GGE28500.1 hypothetical protein GCM10010832_06450 [Psychroflexus planctonicus]
MQNSEDFQHRIWQQYIGFLSTPDLLLDRVLIPYPNLDLGKPINSSELSLSEVNLVELNKQNYLGKRVELFFKEWLENIIEAELLAFSLQVIEDKLTLGEFDFLWKNNNQYFHTELVYKQYIFDRDLSKKEVECWVGPNKKDFLHFKLKKLNENQFPLLYKASTENILQEKLGLEAENFQQNLCFKAQLFVHFQENQFHFKGIYPKAIVGKWYYFEEFNQQAFNPFQFSIIEKQDWPILPQLTSKMDWFSFEEIIQKAEEFINEKRSVKLWMKTPEQVFQLFVIW